LQIRALSASPDPTPSEEPLRQRGCGRGGLRDNRGMNAEGGTGDRRRHLQSGAGSDGAERSPHERAFALALHPWMELVTDPHALEAGPLGLLRRLDNFRRAELLAR